MDWEVADEGMLSKSAFPERSIAVDTNAVDEVRLAVAEGDGSRAVSVAVRTYGAEVFGFLVSVVDRRAASAAYQSMQELGAVEICVWTTAVPLAVWLYSLAWRSAMNQGESPAGASRSSSSATPRRRSEQTYSPGFRDAAARIRGTLTLEERALLVLKVSRGLSWTELAFVQLGAGASQRDLASRARALRAQFGALKDVLRRQGITSGLLQRGSP